jgi:hypothetical protein
VAVHAHVDLGQPVKDVFRQPVMATGEFYRGGRIANLFVSPAAITPVE